MEVITLKAEPREATGTRKTRALRETGMLPVIIYGHGEPPETASLNRHDVESALHHGARTFELTLRGENKRYLIKDVQYDHLGDTVMHMDLTRVDIHERVKVRVGIELRGTPKGVNEGGVLEQYLDGVDVECTVLDIPETLHPLVNELVLGQALFVRDLKLPPGVTMVTPGDERVAAVKAPHEEVAAAAPAEGEEAVAEPEVISRGKKPAEGEGEGEA